MIGLFPSKTANNLKNQFFSIVRRCIRKICRKINAHEYLPKVGNLKSTTLSNFFNILCEKTKAVNEDAFDEETIREMLNFAFDNKSGLNYLNKVSNRQILKETFVSIIILEWAN